MTSLPLTYYYLTSWCWVKGQCIESMEGMDVQSLVPHSSEPVPELVSQLLQQATSSEERDFLMYVTASTTLHATLLPVYSVGVQVSGVL